MAKKKKEVENPMENEAVVKAFVNFNKLETVAIIIENYTNLD